MANIQSKNLTSYRNFLLRNNGGRPEPNSYRTKENEVVSQIQFFFGTSSNENYNLKTNFDYIKGHVGNGYLPIAIDVEGNLILIDMQHNYGHIYLWLHDVFDNEIILIERSFEDFYKIFFKREIQDSEIDIAIDKQNISYFESILNMGAKVDEILTEYGQRIVIVAALKNKVRLLRYFHGRGASMSLTLINAAGNGNYDAVKYLLSLKVDTEERDPMQNGDTALIQAAYGGYFNIVEELLNAGADINAKDIHNQSVFRKAIWSGNDNLINFLEKGGAS